MSVDVKRLRAVAEDHGQRLGMRTEDLARWRFDCPPGAVVELLDELELVKKSLLEMTDLATDKAIELERSRVTQRKIADKAADFLVDVARFRVALTEALALADVPERDQDADWYERRGELAELLEGKVPS